MKMRKSLAVLLAFAMLLTGILGVLPTIAEEICKTETVNGTNKITRKDNILVKAAYTSSIAAPTLGTVATLTDGRYNYVDSGMDKDKDIFDYRAYADFAGWFCYDFGVEITVNKVAFSVGSETNGVSAVDVFITNDPYTAVSANEAGYTPLVSKAEANLRGGTLATFTEAQKGRYIIFKVTSRAVGSSQRAIFVSELAAAGIIPAGAHTEETVNGTNKITLQNNLLTQAVFTTDRTATHGGNVSDLTDGKYYFVDPDAVVFDSRSWGTFAGWFCYDFGVEAIINKVAFSVGAANPNAVTGVDVFITDVPYTTIMANEANYTPVVTLKGEKVRGGTLAQFIEAQKGRYVIFKVSSWATGYLDQNAVFVSELAATGKIPDNAHTTTAMNKGFTVAENLLATAVYSSNVTPTHGGTVADLVDGKCNYADGDAVVFDYRNWNPVDGWFCYDLGTEAFIDKVFYNVGSGNKVMSEVNVYITDDPYTTVQANELNYDPAVTVTGSNIRGGTLAEFLKPQRGRYVIFKISSGLSGNSTQQAVFVSELQAIGATTVTDWHIYKNFVDTESRLMGRQGKKGNEDIGRAIIALSEEELEELAEITDDLVIVGGDYGKETTITLDCAYTYFFNGATQINATDVTVAHTGEDEDTPAAGFVIIDADGAGETISGYGYYRLYKDSADDETNFLFDVMYKNPNN